MVDIKDKKQHLIAGGILEALRKNVSFLSKIPLFLAIPITLALALGVTLSPAFFSIILAGLPIMIVAAAVIGFVNFFINYNNTKKRCEHNLIPELEHDIKQRQNLLKKLHDEINGLYQTIDLDKSKRFELYQTIAELEARNNTTVKPSKRSKILSKISPSMEQFFKYFVIIPGSIGAFGGVLFLVASSMGINVFQMGAIVTFISLTGIGGIVAFGLVIGISAIAMISLFIYKAKFEEKYNYTQKIIHERELQLLDKKNNLDHDIEKCIKLKYTLVDLKNINKHQIEPKISESPINRTRLPEQKPPFYATKKSKAYKISGAILASINESVFMFSKYITFTGLVIVVLGGIGVTFSPVIFIGITAILTLFTLIMAGIGVGKFLGALNAVNKLSDDPVLKHIRSNYLSSVQSNVKPIILSSHQEGNIKYKKFIFNLDSQNGIKGYLLNKLKLRKVIEIAANNFPVIKDHFRAIESVFRYGYLFAVALGAVTSGTILIAGISGVGVTGLGAILSASVLLGFGLPIAAALVIGLAVVLAVSLIIYKKHYENPLNKAQRDASNEKSQLISAQYAALSTNNNTDTAEPKTVRKPIRTTVKAQVDGLFHRDRKRSHLAGSQ